MKIMTIGEFDKISPHVMFATGVMPNSPEGLFMTTTGRELRWVAQKGTIGDWAIYYHWSFYSEGWIRLHGDKVIEEKHIHRCVPCDDEVFKRYRY